MHKIMDFRSDTVTRPSEEMRKVIASAAVGDDIYGDDPSSNALCEYAAEITGKEAAIYACSGTMGNLLAFVAAGRQGESVLAGKRSHVWCSEVGGLSAIAGLCPYPLDDDSGIPAPEELAPANRADGDIHHPETTMPRARKHAQLHGRHSGLAGALRAHGPRRPPPRLPRPPRRRRIFNAAVKYGVEVSEFTKEVDSVQFCLSKGLGAPLGSMLCGSHEFIEKAKKWRKRPRRRAAPGRHSRGCGPLRAQEQHRAPHRGPREREAARRPAAQSGNRRRGYAGHDEHGLLPARRGRRERRGV